MKIILTTLNSKYIHPNLALRWLYVARDPRFDTQIKEYTIKDDLDKITAELVDLNPDVIGMSIYIWNAESSRCWIQKLKEQLPNVRILIGGPEVSFNSEDWLDLGVEAILQGEGEITFWQAVRQEENIDGYVSKHYVSPIRYAKTDLAYLETLEMPYFLFEEDRNRYCYIETSRGCPYQCAYCLSSVDRQVRMFSLDYVLKVIDHIDETTCKQVKFLDRTFNVQPDRALTIARYIAARDKNISYQMEIVADQLPQKVLDFFLAYPHPERFRFEVGIQSFNLTTLKEVNRYQNFDRLKEVVVALAQHGYACHVDLIGGLPYEDLASFEDSYNRLFDYRQAEIQVGTLKLLKGTSLRHHAERYKMKYDEHAPYQLLSNAWVSEADMQVIEEVAFATERIYNRDRAKQSINTLVDLGKVDSVFELMHQCGLRLKQMKQMQLEDIYLTVYEIMKETMDSEQEEELLQCILLTEYYQQFQHHPKRLPFLQVPLELKQRVINFLLKQGEQEHELYNYSNIEWGFHDHRKQIQVHLFKGQHRILWIDEAELQACSQIESEKL